MILGEVGKVSKGQVKPNCRCGALSRRAAYRDFHFERSLGLPYGDWFGNLPWRLEGKMYEMLLESPGKMRGK